MGIQFILGRSGSGKTHHCLEAIREELRREPDGAPLILLVPEQATFQMEQALLAGDDLGGFHRAHVMSFLRLARHILYETAPVTLPVLSDAAREMILRRLLQEHQASLTIFSRTERRAGFIQQLGSTISELRQYQIEPDQLRVQSGHLGATGDARGRTISEKLADLALIYQAYLDHTTDRFIDPDELLDRLADNCAGVSLLRGARLWIDGFAGFTPQQYGVVEALMAQAEGTYVTLCLDAGAGQFRLADDEPEDEGRLDDVHLFHPLLQTYQNLRRRIKAGGVSVSGPMILAGPETEGLGRFGKSQQLRQLEQRFLVSHAADGGDREASDTTVGDSEVVIVEATTRRREVDAVARHILHLCRDKGYRFRDIAVILRDFGPYRDVIAASFTDHEIPHFLDQRREVRHHPLVELIRSAIHLIADDFRSEDLFNYLKTDLVGLPQTGDAGGAYLHGAEARAVIDTLENYARAQGITSGKWRDEERWDIGNISGLGGESTAEELDTCRRAVMGPLIHFRSNLYGADYDPQRTFSVRAITTELARLLEALHIRQTLSEWCSEAEAEGQLDVADIHRTLWSGVMDLLDDLVGALGESAVTVGDLAEILCASLAQLTLGLTPPALEQVLVGTIERSRHPQIRAAFVLGVNDGVFPQHAQPDAIFSDEQRELLAENGMQLAPATSERLLHERYLAYIAFTRPHEFLWVSYPIADEMGQALNASSFIDDLQAAVPEAARLCLADDTRTAELDRITSQAQLFEELAVAASGEPSDKVTWRQLYRYAGGLPNSDAALAGLTYRNDACLDEPIVAGMFGSGLTMSVSRLESFGACPFQHFGRYGLALRGRDELKLGAVDLGNFYHHALRRMFVQLRDADLTWSELAPGRLKVLLDETVDDLAGRGQFSRLFSESERSAFLLNEARRRLERFCLSLISAARAGRFRQVAAELKFGPDGDMPALQLDLGGGRSLGLIGSIDRVDTASRDDGLGLVVFDYKSTARPFAFGQFYHGLALQLLSYLLVVSEQYPFERSGAPLPVAALYLPVMRRGQSQSGAPPDHVLQSIQSDEAEADRPHKAVGVINGDWVGDLDQTQNGPGWSKYFGMYINKDGSAYTASNRTVVSSDEMSALLKHCRGKLGELAGELAGGTIEVAPYRLNRQSPCTVCEFRSLCRFDPRGETYRILPDLDRDGVLAKMC